MKNNKLVRSQMKHIRAQKAQIRREFLTQEEKDKKINLLYGKFKSPVKNKDIKTKKVVKEKNPK